LLVYGAMEEIILIIIMIVTLVDNFYIL